MAITVLGSELVKELDERHGKEGPWQRYDGNWSHSAVRLHRLHQPSMSEVLVAHPRAQMAP